MKVPNLKTLDYKQIGIDHGEKAAVALVGLLLLFVLWTTKWSQPIAETPTELISKAETTDTKIKEQPWPDAEMKLLKTGTDLKARAASLLTPLDVSPWRLPIALNKPYHPDRTLISKPRWLPVKDLIADAQAVDLEMDPKVARLNEGFTKLKRDEPNKQDKAKKGEKKDKEPEEKPEIPEELKRTSTGGGGGPAGGGIGMGGFTRGLGGIGGRMGGGMGGMRGGRGGDPNQRVANQGKRQRRKKGAQDDNDEAMAKNDKKEEKPVGRGYHVVAVRGVFPLREQVTELSQKMGSSVTRHEAQDLIQMHDYVIERQTAKPGPEPWSGKWEPVDRDSTLEMFRNDVYSFVPEPVSDGIVDYHICMPLPVRLIGEWGKLATHPDVKDFALSPDEVKMQLEYQRKVIAKMQEDDKKKTEKETKDKGGFVDFVKNPRQIQKRGAAPQVDENTKPIQDQILDDLKKAPKDRPDEEQINAKLTEYITKHATPQDHLLLFRYVDFTVEPGKIYRYRVKLVVDNPFHNRHVEEVSDPSLIEGETRDTEYSLPTRPVYVPEDAKFFVAHVDAHPGRSTLPSAKVDLYQWFASTGTIVNREIVAQIGQLFGGRHIAEVINPAEGLTERERVPFSTSDALVDMASGFSLDPGLHRDLIAEIAASDTKDKSDPKDKKSSPDRKTGSMIPDVLVFVDGNGALQVIDGLDQEEDHQREKQRYNYQKSEWSDLSKPDEDNGKGKSRRGRRAPGMGGLGGGFGAGGGRPNKKGN